MKSEDVASVFFYARNANCQRAGGRLSVVKFVAICDVIRLLHQTESNSWRCLVFTM